MKLCFRIGATIFIMLLFQNAWAISIVAPKEGETFDAGAKVDVIVKPDTGESWEQVLLEIVPMSYSLLTGSYKETIELPADSTGNIVITVIAADKSGRVVKLRRNITAKIPVNVVLRSMEVFDQDYLLLYKLLAGSKPEDIQRIESDQLKVSGIYSDGIKRNITASASGTIYSSTNEKIVTVSQEGKVTPQGIGEAQIVVRNGKITAQVYIVVKPYRQPQR